MSGDRLLDLLAKVSSAEDEIRGVLRTPVDRERSRSQLVSSVSSLDQGAAPRSAPAGRLDEFVCAQLTELLGPTATRRAVEIAAAAVGRTPDALTWDTLDAVVAALRPLLVELLGAEIASSELERLCLAAAARRM